ncbi:MAG: CZB domain-containing protein [Sulfuritalea sp.]|nr:CZB domain-containing protein [Sulfuritalea sp.]
MDFDDAIAAHIKWKVRLSQFIDGTGAEHLNSTDVCKDNLCDLGKWIHGEGTAFKAAPHYQDLVGKHAHFHVCAAEIVRKVEGGDKAGAKAALGGPFVGASRATVAAIMTLKAEAAKL